jgi:hydrogenase maturation protease
MMEKSILVLGVGNLLRCDEGAGIHVAREMSGMLLPEAVEVLDGGTLGAELIGVIQGREKVFLVDAMKVNAPPGAVFRVPLEELTPEITHSMSVHGTGVGELLFCCRNLDPQPEIIIYGIVPELIDCWSVKLTAAVQSRISSTVALILEEIATGKTPRGVLPPMPSLVPG